VNVAIRYLNSQSDSFESKKSWYAIDAGEGMFFPRHRAGNLLKQKMKCRTTTLKVLMER
jgi:hypothetical protein